MILAGDVGGTKVVLALFDDGGGELRLLREATFASREHASFEELLAAFLGRGSASAVRAACLAVAGAIVDGACRVTNLPWTLEEAALARMTGAAHVKLLNDAEAAGYGVLHLRPDECAVLQPGTEPRRQGNIAVLSCGTGLGAAMLYWDGARHQPIASESGHADFAPRTDQEIALLRHLRDKFGGHVSYERVLSGPGLHNIYMFLRDSGYAPEPPWLAEQLGTGDPTATIARVGLAGEEALCTATLDLFSSIFGAAAGNLALHCLAVGGGFIEGGVSAKILPALQRGRFVRGFTEKGRFSGLLKGIEVRVALKPRTPLLGAAHVALGLATR
jgi:glucokinase